LGEKPRGGKRLKVKEKKYNWKCKELRKDQGVEKENPRLGNLEGSTKREALLGKH